MDKWHICQSLIQLFGLVTKKITSTIHIIVFNFFVATKQLNKS